MDPGTWMVIGTLGSAIMGGVSAGLQASQQKKMAEYQEEVYKQQAEQARKVAQREAERRSRLNRARQSANIARIGASGLTLGSESPLAVMSEQAASDMQAVRNILWQGETRRTGLMNQANLYHWKGSSISPVGSGLLSAGMSTLRGVASSPGLFKKGLPNIGGWFQSSPASGVVDMGATLMPTSGASWMDTGMGATLPAPMDWSPNFLGVG